MAVRPRRPRVYFAAAQSPVVGVNHDLFPSPTMDTWGTSISGRYNHNLASDPHTSVWQRLGNSKARTPRSGPAGQGLRTFHLRIDADELPAPNAGSIPLM